MDRSRRHFLRMAGYGIGSAAYSTMVDRFLLSTALAQGRDNYRALVLIFLAGGNDGNNTVIPYDGYQAYSQVRGPSGLAIAQNALLQISTTIGTFGLHPNLRELQTLYNQQKLAIVCNVGPLVQPLTRDQYIHNSVPIPYQLFSHADQIAQWQTSRADTHSGTGWGGRVADTFGAQPGYPMITSISGNAIFGIGTIGRPLAINAAPTALNSVLVLNGFGTSSTEQARRASFDYIRTLNRSQTLIKYSEDATQQGLDIGALLTVDPVINTVFPNTTLGNQLKQVAKVIKANQTIPLGLTRQIFFTQLGGFDTHQNEPSRQGDLLTQLSQAMNAFYNATVELNVSNSVTTFTHSDFSRTFQPSGSGTIVGTDHAWGNHHFVMGDAVSGGAFYGVPGSNGTVYPTLQLGGPDDTDTRGRFIPTASVEQYAATLASWYGVSEANMTTVFPLLPNFPIHTAPYLNFMTP